MLRREVVEDELDIVPKAKLKKALRELGEDPEKGKVLGGALKGARSIRIAGENRLVYRLSGDGEETTVEVIAIGRRRDSEVYETAARRD